jgi:hypothetical protein
MPADIVHMSVQINLRIALHTFHLINLYVQEMKEEESF